MQSVTHAYLNVQDLLRSVKVFDPHPPLFYLQLHYWMKLSTSDLWILLNPFSWGVLTIISLIWICNRIYGKRAALLTGILCALGLVNLLSSLGVRMYAMMFFFSVWIWYFTHQYISGYKTGLMSIGLVISSVIYLYSQGANFIILPAIASYAVFLTISNHPYSPRLWRFLLINGFIVIIYIPWLIQARSITVGHTVAPGFTEFEQMAATMLFSGYWLRVVNEIPGIIFASLLFCLIIVLLLSHRVSRLLTFSFILVPLIASAAISHIYRPIWVAQSLSPTSTFLYIGIALLMDNLLDRPDRKTRYFFEWGVVGLYFSGVMLVLIFNGDNFTKWVPLKQPVALVKQNLQPGDTVFIPDERTFWGWAWYFFGPGSVNPLQTTYDFLSEDNVRTVAGLARRPQMKPGARYWIVQRIDQLSEVNLQPNEEINSTYEFDATRIDLVASPP